MHLLYANATLMWVGYVGWTWWASLFLTRNLHGNGVWQSFEIGNGHEKGIKKTLTSGTIYCT